MPDAPDVPDLNLNSILLKEEKAELSHIDPEFYDKATKLLNELEVEKNRNLPDTLKSKLSLDLLETSKAKVEQILHVRMRKIVSRANSQFVKNEKDPVPESLTPEERELYTALIDLLSAWKKKRIDQIFGKKSEKKETGIVKEPEKKQQQQQVQAGNKKDAIKDYILVRMLADVPTFVGIDNRNYTLAKEDVVTLPAVNATALVAKKAAVPIVMKKY